MDTHSLSSCTRRRLMLLRWLTLAGYAIVAGTFAFCAEPFLQRLGAPLAERLASTRPLVLVATLVVMAVAACYIGRDRWRGLLGIRFLLSYPPLWVAVVCGMVMWVVWCAWAGPTPAPARFVDDLVWFQAQLPGSLRLVIVLAAGAGILWTTPLRPYRAILFGNREKATPASTCRLTSDFDELRAWLHDDREIATPDLDCFGHDAVARRIAERLGQAGEVPTMAVVGPFGSGKSTIRSLVKHHLRDKPTVRIIELSLWPFETPEAAVGGILQALVSDLRLCVNVLPLIGLPDEYVGVIDRTGGSFGGIASVLRGSHDPQQIVDCVSDIACAMGLRLVLWIEDLERFSGGDELKGEALEQREVERLGPIRALLHLLDRSPQISVVVSDVSLRTRFDLAKIVRFVEEPPSMDSERVRKVIVLLRDRCLGGYPVRIIDPASREARAAFLPTEETGQHWPWLSHFRDSPRGVLDGVALTLRTPRALKSALRTALDTWEKMPGEIDFDSVLVASVIRVSRPDLFAIVTEYIDLFRHRFTNPFGIDKKKAHHPVATQTRNLIFREDQRDAASLQAMLSFVFPAYPPEGSSVEKEHVSRPQSLFVDNKADYWRRYLAHIPVDPGTSDQRALASIVAWRDGRPSDLLDRIVDSARSDQIEQFVGQFEGDDLCRLLSEVADKVAPQSAAEWADQTRPPGITSVWQMMRARPPCEESVLHAVASIITRTVPLNLPLAIEVMGLFAPPGQGDRPAMSDAHRRDVVQMFRGSLRPNFTGHGAEQRLLGALKEGSPYLIHRAVTYGTPSDRQDAATVPGWSDLSNVLLSIAESCPATGVPFVVPLVTHGDTTIHTNPRLGEHGAPALLRQPVAHFEEREARRLFDFDRLVRVLADFNVPDNLDTSMKLRCQAAVDAAKGILSKGTSSPSA